LRILDVVVISGVGSYRPYDGQALYFGKLYYTVDSIIVDNPGSGYNPLNPPTVTNRCSNWTIWN